MLGVSFHPSISAEKLREKIAAFQAETPETQQGTVTDAPIETQNEKLMRVQAECEKLVRIRLTCMNPMKKEWDGEIITAGNALGTYKKFIPYAAEDGWHVPNIIYQVLKERQCQVFYTDKTKNGVSVRRGKLIREFAIEVLDPLTKEELNDLAKVQALAAGVAV